MQPWSYSKEQVLGAPVTLSVAYQPKPLRLVGTIMDTYRDETHLNGGLKVFCKYEETNMMLWVPLANPKIKVEISPATGTFEHFLEDRDRWDEAFMSGKARLK